MSKEELEAQPAGTEAFLPEVKTNRTQISVRPSYGECHTNNCQPANGAVNSGFAACATISVQLPLTAQVLTVRYYTSAGYPNDSAECPELAAGENAWAYIDPAQERTEGAYKYVEAGFHNRSHNRVRRAAIEVDYSE
jgi:hypothetical protein